MEPPNKRPRPSSPNLEPTGADFVSLSVEDDEITNQYGYGNANAFSETSQPDFSAPRGPRAMYQEHHRRDIRNDPRHAKDRPKSKHSLPGLEPWVLVRTKFGRKFVHNEETKESFWRIPGKLMLGVREFEALETQQKQKDANAKWAEDQLKQMRTEQSQATRGVDRAKDDGRSRRRRSESLQREDEEALMAELAAEAEKAEERDVQEVVKTVEPLQPKTVDDANGGYGSDSSYEEVEVTDSEFEDDDPEPKAVELRNGDIGVHAGDQNEGPMEFGEDDIAYQLAAMEQDYDDQGDYEEEAVQPEEYYEEEEGPEFNEAEAITTFRSMLDDHGISPFTPWEKLVADESDSGIIVDDRYTVLPNMRARKEVWEAWVKDTAARIQEARAKAESRDPRIPYLAFLAENASPKLYWPEFKRKYRKESVLNDRKLNDKDREKLYRDHINRLKLPERTRKADLLALLKTIPLKDLNKTSSLHALPQRLLAHLHSISLPAATRDEVIATHISTLPRAPPDGEGEDEDGELASEHASKRRAEQEKRDEALRARERQVVEEKRNAGNAERWARRDLMDEERELRSAMDVGRAGLRGQLGE